MEKTCNNLGWKEKWSNICDYKLDGQTIILETKTGKIRLISNIAPNDIASAMKYVETKLLYKAD